MHLPSLTTSTTLFTLALAAALPSHPKRAGGPIPVPIPSNCTLANPLPNATNATNNNQISGYRPSTIFAATHSIYSSYFDAFLNQSAEWQQCLEQCYGYEGCKAAILAYDVAVPEGYYGGPGGELATACLMYDKFIETQDFVLAKEGRWVNETAENIVC